MKIKLLTGIALGALTVGCSDSAASKPKSSSAGNAIPAEGFTDKTAGGASEKANKTPKVEDSGKKKVE